MNELHEVKELQKYLAVRKKIYSLLGYAFYKEADAEYIAELRTFMPIFKELQGALGNEHLLQGIDYVEATSDAELGILKMQFARIFLSTSYATKLKSVVPQESVYLSPNRISMQDQRDEVLEIYYSEGIGKNKDFHEPDDHITAEFHFMSQMSQKSIDDLDSGITAALPRLKLQVDFLNNHILKWVPAVCDDIVEITETNFFKAVAKLTNGFIETDCQMLTGLIEQ